MRVARLYSCIYDLLHADPAHEGIEGNEVTNSYAKGAAE